MNIDLNKHRSLSKSYRMFWRFIIYGGILFALLYLINQQQKDALNQQNDKEFEINTDEIITPNDN